MDDEFLQKLELLRHRVGFPLIVSSGYRCPAHNVECSTTGPMGPHTTGRAVDLAVRGYEALAVVATALAVPGQFKGIGIKQHGDRRFIHLDDLVIPGKRPTIWSYP
jgi:uncharacterized protein YcbK (DUF882 family)